jgi:general secretion pathway protein A
MYERFFNLTADPFRLSPDHRFCYRHAHYSKAKAYMAYAFRRAEGFVLVTGPPGTGKTTLIADLLEYLAKKNVVVANLVSTQLAEDDLLRSVAFAFEVEAKKIDKSTILEELRTEFLAWSEQGKRALLIVDEAQDLKTKAMEELRLLTNLQKDQIPLLQIFLLGQPELRDLVHQEVLEPVHQRIIATSHLKALQEDETRGYVEHRLNIVGWKNDPEISPRVFEVIYLFSEGIPRRINLICNRLLLHAFVEQRHKITVADARVVIEELQEEQLSTRDLLGESVFMAVDDEPESGLEQSAPAESYVKPKGKAQFAAQEVSPTSYSPGSEGNKKASKNYTGPEQRRGHRRTAEDRRNDVRFEMDKEDRRKNRGRRHDDKAPDFW